jgi:hypothetical protein
VNEPDEDNLAREPTVSPEAVDEPPKRGRGRPKGLAKTGGRVRGKVPHQRYDDHEAHTVLGSMMADVVAFHYAVMRGETKATFNGPTGKPIERFPNLPERQKSADWLSENFWRLDEKLKASPATVSKADSVEEADAAELRKAVLDDMLAHMPAQATPPPVLDVAPQANSDGIVHITDPEQIKAWDAEQRAKPKAKSDPNTKTYPNGFSWQRRYDENTRVNVFDLYNSAGLLCGHRRSQERADAWCLGEGTSL